MSQNIFTPEQQAERRDVALRAACETEAIALHLNAVIPVEQPEYLHLRALVVRILALNNVIWSALDDVDDHCVDDMRRVVEGR